MSCLFWFRHARCARFTSPCDVSLHRVSPAARRSAKTLNDSVSSVDGKRQFLRGRIQGESVSVVSGPGSHLVAGLAAAAFVLLAVLGQFGSVGLAGNGYPGPIFLLAASLAGWVLVRQAACLAAVWPKFSAVLAYLGRATMPIVILHFLSFKLVTWLGLLATGGEPYLLAAFPTYFTGGLWWLAYTVVGLALPLAGDWVYKKVREAFPLGGRWPKAG